MTKLTYAMAIDVAINSVESTEVKEKLEALKASLAKKNSGTRKPTATQLENTELKNRILEAMEADKAYTITELTKSFDFLADLSNQKVSAIVRQMVESGVLNRDVVKRKAYFTKA